jgi:16S rRNA C967 or C1407 C5-methylase (RsmB/RsmF family)
LPAENQQVVEAVLAQHPGARSLPLEAPGGAVPWLITSLGAQLLPSDEAPVDGFYYACLTVS